MIGHRNQLLCGPPKEWVRALTHPDNGRSETVGATVTNREIEREVSFVSAVIDVILAMLHTCL